MRKLSLAKPAIADSSFLQTFLSSATTAPFVSSVFANMIKGFSSGLRRCDATDEGEFRAAISLASKLGFLGVQQNDIARRLMITPYAIPRKAYLSELAIYSDEIADQIMAACASTPDDAFQSQPASLAERLGRLELVAADG
jgi:hypothetical protein